MVLLSIAGVNVKMLPSKARTAALFPARMHRAKVQSPPVILPSSLQGFQDCGQHLELLLWPSCVGRVLLLTLLPGKPVQRFNQSPPGQRRRGPE